ncbi:MAG: hypothetical protein ACREJ3_00925, partial [Polyangiaceae bacterium]
STVGAMAGATAAGRAMGATATGCDDAADGEPIATGGAADSTLAAGPGTLGPRRIPVNRGHATPTMKPIAAMTPTRLQEGRSASGDGRRTAKGGLATFRTDIVHTFYHMEIREAKNQREHTLLGAHHQL